MIFWNDRKLARRFARDEVPAKERLYYLLIFTLMVSALYSGVGIYYLADLFFPGENAPVLLDYCADGLVTVIALAGTIWCWKTNQKGDGKEFLERYICLGFPVMIQLIVLMSVTYFIVGIGYVIFFSVEEISDQITILDVLILVLLNLFFFTV